MRTNLLLAVFLAIGIVSISNADRIKHVLKGGEDLQTAADTSAAEGDDSPHTGQQISTQEHEHEGSGERGGAEHGGAEHAGAVHTRVVNMPVASTISHIRCA